MEQSELNHILDQHRLWLDGKGGVCADLTDADLTDADLTDANLTVANLNRANLTGANLTVANLSGANLWRANLSYANLTGANFTDASLYCANLECANLECANLTGANLYGADLRGASLYRANLEGAYLKDATVLPNVSWIIPGCLVQLNHIKYEFYLEKEDKWESFVQDSFGFIIQNNSEEETFDMLIEDRIIRNIPHWVKYSGLRQVATESV